MVKVGDVWDSTTDVLAGRYGSLVPIAALAFVLLAALDSFLAFFGPRSAAMGLLGIVLTYAALVATLWGTLAVAAVASDPAATRADASRLATARLGKGLLVVLVLIGAVILLVLPIILALAASGFDFSAAAQQRATGRMPAMAPGAALFVFLYGLTMLAILLWAAARLFLLYVVVVNEGRGIGAIGRSIQLTRGMTLKLLGVVLVLTIGYGVALAAIQSVVGLAVRLALGPQNVATSLFMAALAGAVLTAAFTTLVQVFAARLYAALVGPAVQPPA